MFAHSAHATAAGRGRLGGLRAAAVGEAEPQRGRHRRHRRSRARAGCRGPRAREHRARHGHRRPAPPYRLGSGPGGGGLSGPAIRPVAVRAVHDCRAAFPDVGIVGVGGVCRGVDAAEMLLAGADAVEVGTATFRDPRARPGCWPACERWCRLHDVGDVRDLVGAVHGVPGAGPTVERGSPLASTTPPFAASAGSPAGAPPWATTVPEPPGDAGPGRARPIPVTRPEAPTRLPPSPRPPARPEASVVDGDPRDRLALALDVDDLVVALRLARRLRPWFGVAKVGLELFGAAGPEAVSALTDEGYRVFLDLKLHDIPTTVLAGGPRARGPRGGLHHGAHAGWRSHGAGRGLGHGRGGIGRRDTSTLRARGHGPHQRRRRAARGPGVPLEVGGRGRLRGAGLRGRRPGRDACAPPPGS